MLASRLAILALALAAFVLAAALAHGCGLPRFARGNARAAEGAPVAVPVTRVPIEREPLPLPDLPDMGPGFALAAPAASDDAQALATKAELARLVAQIEQVRQESATAAYKLAQSAKQELADAQKARDVELAALEQELAAKTKALADQSRAATYDANRWLWAVIAAAIAAVVYSYKRVSLAAAALALTGFGLLFALILAGQHYPRLVALAPVPFIALIAYIAYRDGVLSEALRACVRGIELSDNDKVKAQVSKQDPRGAVERAARKDIDAATQELALARLADETAARRRLEAVV